MKKKRVVSLVLVVLLALVFETVAFATEPDANTLDFRNQTRNLVTSGTMVSESSITNAAELSKIADEENLEIPEGYRLIEVATTVINDENSLASERISTIQPKAANYTIKNMKTASDKYYTDDYDSSWYQGKCNISQTYSQTRSASMSVNMFGISVSIVSANVGFTIGSSYTKSENFSTSVASNQKLNLRVHTNYQVKTFDVYKDNVKQGSTSAWKPIGLIFKQYRYAA